MPGGKGLVGYGWAFINVRRGAQWRSVYDQLMPFNMVGFQVFKQNAFWCRLACNYRHVYAQVVMGVLYCRCGTAIAQTKGFQVSDR